MTSTTRRTPTVADLRATATRQLHVGIGATDLAVTTVKEYVAGVQQRLDIDPLALRNQAVAVASARIETLSRQAKARREATEARVAELRTEAKALPVKVQTLLADNTAAAVGRYDDLARRGETVLSRTRHSRVSPPEPSAAQAEPAAKKAAPRSRARRAGGTKSAR
jgi:heparin binding hemagglutinin HbhA